MDNKITVNDTTYKNIGTSSTNMPYTYDLHYGSNSSTKTVKELKELIEERQRFVVQEIDKFIKEDLTEEMAIQVMINIVNQFGFDIEDLKTKIIIESI